MDIRIETITSDDGRPVLVVSGAIDLQTRDRLGEAGRALLANGVDRLVLDLSGVRFIDSTGIGALVELGHDAADANAGVVIRRPSERVLRILEITGLVDAWDLELEQPSS